MSPEIGISPAEQKELEQELELPAEIAEERRGLRGAMVIASITVGLLFLGWLYFYFGLFLRRG
jgi:hypothetical protein